MRRRVFTLLSAVPLLLCVATIALWVRSYWVSDGVRTESVTTVTTLASSRGSLWLYHATMPPARIRGRAIVPIRWLRTTPFDATRRSPILRSGSWANFSMAGFGFFASDGGTIPATNPSGFSQRILPAWNGGVPLWFLAAAFLLLPMVHRLTRRRPIPGQCPACGYDLRATPDRCPECGTVPANKGTP
ncbi:MAG TPA: hypothetical protein VG269_04345 [Tepidisphaeraceae bacterium]|jgi:hypothetical protein|nr:hypothetical protein [Tepidisphaeraceae bacterium]